MVILAAVAFTCYGGMSVANAPGGSSYGSILQPLILGSQAAVLRSTREAQAGGAMKVTVTGKLHWTAESQPTRRFAYEGGGGVPVEVFGSSPALSQVAASSRRAAAPAITLKEEVAAVDESQLLRNNNFGARCAHTEALAQSMAAREHLYPTPTRLGWKVAGR